MQKRKIKNPFVGLRSFEEDEDSLFFGRDTQIKDILDNLMHTNFGAVIGYSGSGKSSIVKSGIISILENEGHWNISVTNPGNDPLQNLAKTLLDIRPESKTNSENEVKQISEFLAQSDSSIIRAIKKINKNHSGKHLLIIDQFEEIFRLTKTDDLKKATHFVNLLLNAFKKKENNIYIILTLRSDFIGNCTEFEGLPEALNQSQYLIPRLNTSQFKEVINGPLARLNHSISNSLLNILIGDIANNQDQLPIFQHAMMRTFDYWNLNSSEEQLIDVHHYKAIGTMKKALSNHADEAFEELNTEERKACSKMFKVLANFENLKVTRNPIKFSELVKITAFDRETLIKVINTFRRSDRSFLSPKEGVEIIDSTIIDISHESLLRLWSRLRVWIKEEMESYEIYKNLCETAALFQEGKGSLLIDPELEIILKWRENEQPTESWGLQYDFSYLRAINFLEDSKVKFDQDVIFKNLTQTKRIKRTKQFNIFISVACVICLFLGVLSWIEKEKANKQKEIAVKSKNSEKEARESAVILKDEAVKSEGIAKRATLTANNAEKIAIVKSKEAEKSRLEAVKNKNEAITAKEIADDAKNEALESAKKEKIAAESARLASARAKKEEKEANRLKNLSDAIKMAFESEKSFDLKSTDKGIKEAINSYQLYSENTQDTKRQNQIYSALNRALFEGKNFRSKFYKHNLGLKKIEKASNNNLFALLDNSQTVSIIRENLEGLNKVPNVAFSNISDLKFSNNGDKLILSTITGELKIYNTNNFNTISKNLTFESSIKSIQNFTFSGIEYLLVSEGKKYHLINLVNYEKIDSNKLIEFNAYKNIFSKNGNYIASYQKENILLYSFDISSLGLSLKLINTISSSKEVSTLKFLSSTMIATGSQKGVVKIYKISKSGDVSFYKQITNHKDVKISDIDIYQDVGETYIITSSFDNTLNITNLDKLEELITFKDYNGWVTDMYFEETEKKIYSISQDSFLRYWLIDSKDILKLLKKS